MQRISELFDIPVAGRKPRGGSSARVACTLLDCPGRSFDLSLSFPLLFSNNTLITGDAAGENLSIHQRHEVQRTALLRHPMSWFHRSAVEAQHDAVRVPQATIALRGGMPDVSSRLCIL